MLLFKDLKVYMIIGYFCDEIRASFLYKPQGRNTTSDVTSGDALQQLKTGLQSPLCTYIYHCQNHYFCPIGFEDVPLSCEKAYRWLVCVCVFYIYIANPATMGNIISCTCICTCVLTFDKAPLYIVSCQWHAIKVTFQCVLYALTWWR